MRNSARLRWTWMFGFTAGMLALPLGVLLSDPLAAAPPKAAPKLAKKNVAAAAVESDGKSDDDTEPADDKAHIRLNYASANWEKVLQDFAKATNTELVADQVPKGRFGHFDLKRYTQAEALKILNKELEPLNFRLLFKGRFLVVNRLHEFRHEYSPAVLRGDFRKSGRDAGDEARETAATADSRKRTSKTQAGEIVQAGESRRATSRGERVRHAAADEDAEADRGAEYDPQPAPVETTVKLKARDAGAVATHIYRTFGKQAERTDAAPQGLKGFHVRRLPKGKQAGETVESMPLQFTIGVDKNRNELIVAASAAESRSIVKVIKALDNVPRTSAGSGTARLVRTRREAGKLATALQPELDRLAQVTRKTAQRRTQPEETDEDPAGPDGQDTDEQMPSRGTARERADEAGERALFGSLKGDVLVESVPELGILVIRGNQADVEAVEKVIEEIERLSVQTAPRVKLAMLRHISSEALASLLTTVYERLAGARNSAVQQSQAISVFPVARPNAVLIVASNADIDAVFALIDELDQPSDPATEFMIIRLKRAIASQVVDQIEALYPAQTQQQQANQQQGTVGLLPRVKVIEDVRTNSVIVQARPRDLLEVARLIKEIDANDPGTEQQVKFFKLEYAVAEEVAATLSTALQRVLDPARATGTPGSILGQQGNIGQQQQQGGATGQTNSELRAVKSAILEFLDLEGEQGRKIRSGILSDIRMTADFRTNSIVVTAPKESMDFVSLIINKLDQPASHVADIKVFRLKNSDATAMQTLLERLFGVQRTGQGAGGQGGQGQQQQAGQIPGLSVADAEDSSSMLIPLRFSTDVRTNSIVAVGGAAALDVVNAVLIKLDASDIRQRENEVYRLKNSPAQNVATAIQQFLQSQQQALTQNADILSPFEQIEREVIVVPEATSNSLLISATPRYIKDILEVVRKLDRTPQQVVIQALIVEVQLNTTDELGIELGAQNGVLFQRSEIPTDGVTTISTTSTSPGQPQVTSNRVISQSGVPGYKFNGQPLGNNTSDGVTNPSAIGGQIGSLFNTAITNSTLGYGGLILQAGSQNLNFLLRALAARTRVDILSRPLVRALDNQRANIQVGQEIPRVTGFTPNATTGVNSPVVQQRQIGIILEVIPRISPDGLVVMDISARKDALNARSFPLVTNADGSTVNSPIFDTTNTVTTIGVPSGQTIVLAGMITKQETVEERKVPVIGDIPFLGRAFRYDFKESKRTELLIFLTPRVVHSDEEAEMIKQIEIERLNFLESEAERMHGPLYGMPEFCPPPGGSSSGTAPNMLTPMPASPTGPTIKEGPTPTPTGFHPLQPSTSRRIREPNPMPGLEPHEEQEASFERDDDEDMSAGFTQTGYSTPREKEGAATQPKRVSSANKSPLPGGSAKKPAADKAAPAKTTKNQVSQGATRREVKSPAKSRIPIESEETP